MKQLRLLRAFLFGLFVFTIVFGLGSENVLAAPPKPEFEPTCTQVGSTWSITLTWSPVPGADLYPVRIKSPSGVETAVDNVYSWQTSYTFTNLTAPGTYDTWMHALSYSGGWSDWTVKPVTCSAPSTSICTVATDSNFRGPTCSGICANGYSNYPTCTPPPAPSPPTGLRAEPFAGSENVLSVRWDSMFGATYYAVRHDNNSDSMQYGSEPLLSACINESTTDDAILQQGGEYNGTYAGIDACGNTRLTELSLFSMASSYNHIWVHACNTSGCSRASEILVTLDPPSPTIVSASCDMSGNATVSWNPIPVPGGLDRHYSFRLDNQSNSWQFDVNSYRTNHDSCAFDSVDASGVLAVPSGVGTDYCGNIRNTSWSGVINPSGTQKAWVHTKSRNYLSFGNRPPSEIIFSCSGGSPTSVSGVCGTANGGTFPVPPAANLCITGTPSPLPVGSGPWSWTCLGSGGGVNSPLCSASQSVATEPTASVLTVCQNSCGSRVKRGQSGLPIAANSFSMIRGEIQELVACYGVNTECSPLDPSTNITGTALWNEGGNSTISLSDQPSSKRITADNDGTEDISVSANGQRVDMRVGVPCVETVTCASEQANVCNAATVASGTTLAGVCGPVNCGGLPGTRSCDYNWREVAP